MRHFNRLRLILISLMGLLGIALAFLPFVMQMTEAAVDRTSRHDMAWNGINGRSEYQELRHTLMTYALNPTKDGQQAAELAYDIFVSRLNTWRAGVFGVFVEASPARRAIIGWIADSMHKIETDISHLDNDRALTRVLAELDRIDADVEQLARDSYTTNTEEIAANTIVLRKLQIVQQSLIIGLIGSGFVLVVLLLLQNRLLGRAHKAEKAISAENAFLAAHDILTGLPNRTSLHTALAAACQTLQSTHPPAVLIIDLDGFKPINDVLGHKAGDQLLVSVAQRLERTVRSAAGNLACRFGGDEFVVLLQGAESPASVLATAHTLLQVLREPHRVDQHKVSIDATIGIAFLDQSDIDPNELIHRADIALNAAKAKGKGMILVFEPRMATGIEARQKLEADLAEADPWAEFEPHYQPLVDIASGEILGVEALARWHHPTRGMVSPGEFIPAAESSGRIVEIGRIMIEKACRDAMRFPKPIAVSVNLSTVQLIRMDVPALVADVLAKTKLPPSRLKLEITESVMIHDAKGTRALVGKLQAMGVTVSLDDFGTGYSSLSYLRRFGFDELKIDRSFVGDLDQDRQSMAIVQTIIALAQNLDIKVIAEGIETEEQAKMVVAAGCAHGQGYLFGRPLPFDKVLSVLGSVPTARAA